MEEVVNEGQVTQDPVDEISTPVVESTTQAPGSKTPPDLLLKSLQEEREKRKELEDRLTLLESSSSSEVFSDEGKVLESQIHTLKSQLTEIKTDNAKKDVLLAHPELKDRWHELEEFRNQEDNKGMNLKTATKAFLIEKGLFEPQRKGLEKTTGGARQPVSQDMSIEDIKSLRETNPRKYEDMLVKGLIKFS